MFEFNLELVVGDDQEANTESLHYQAGGEEGSDGEEEEEEEAIDITNTAGYSDESVLSLPKLVMEGQQPQAGNTCISVHLFTACIHVQWSPA